MHRDEGQYERRQNDRADDHCLVAAFLSVASHVAVLCAESVDSDFLNSRKRDSQLAA